MPSTQRFSALDSFRGLAALAIVVCHLPLLLADGEPGQFVDSAVYVQFFFVLSGFVLFHANGARLGTPAAFGRFLTARGFRILPVHLCLLGLILLLGDTRPDAESASALLANLLLLQAWLPTADDLSLNPAAWTLSLGFYFSLFFGLALLALPRGRSAAYLLLAALALGGLLSGFDDLHASLLLGAVGFFLGAMLYPLQQSLRLLPLSQRAFTILEVTVLALLGLILDSSYLYRELYATLVFALLLLIFTFEGGLLSRLLRHRLPLTLGRWAFALYLSHLVLFMALAELLPLLPQPDVPWRDPLQATAAVLVAIALSALLHRYIERPGIVLGQRLLAPRSGTAQAGNASEASG